MKDRERLREALADVAHQQWSHWQCYLHSKCTKNPDGSLTIPADLVARWGRQMNTEYSSLSDSEKKSDRDQTIRIFDVLEAFGLV